MNLIREMVIARQLRIDYLLVVDFDIQSIETDRLYTEFAFATRHLQPNVFCVNGVEYSGRYRDNFATVFADGEWCFDGGAGAKCHCKLQKERLMRLVAR